MPRRRIMFSPDTRVDDGVVLTFTCPPQLLFVYTEEGSSKGGSDANSICSPLAGCANRSSAA